MNVQTTRFGPVDIEPDDILFFRHGVFGFETCQHWVILADGSNPTVAWLQSMQTPEVALPVVSPRRFVPDYHVRLDSAQVQGLHLKQTSQAHLLTVVSRDEESLTLNLRAPLVVNLDRRLGCQLVTAEEHPMQYELTALPLTLRRIA